MWNARRIAVALVAAVAVVGVSLGGWWFFIRDDAPPEASVDALDDNGDADGAGDGSSVTAEDVAGTWTIDPEFGSFEDFSGNFAGYRIEEELASIGGNTAAGRTPDVTGSLTVGDNQVTDASFEVDMTTLESDEDFRDSALEDRGLQTAQFPTATFTLTAPVAIPGDAAAGETLSLEATGDLNLHGVTKSITVTLQAILDGDHIKISGSAPVLLADYNIEKPEGLSVVSVADEGTFEFQLALTKDGG